MMKQEAYLFNITEIDHSGNIITAKELKICNSRIIEERKLEFSKIDLNVITEWTVNSENVLCPNFKLNPIENEKITASLIKVEGGGSSPKSFITEYSIDPVTKKCEGSFEFLPTNVKVERILNLPEPNLITCQNCEGSFVSKYDYQRHHCDLNLNAQKIVPSVESSKNTEQIPDISSNSLVNENKIEQCDISRQNDSVICEFCNKSFINANRLKIHKENHCKKAGDITKFYRSDVVVWQCNQCKQVFSTEDSGNNHIHTCITLLLGDDQNETRSFHENNEEINHESVGSASSKLNVPELEKIMTEMLYQCEFCNRTYASRAFVIAHQRTHTVEKNYECIFCEQHFDCYTEAVTHWQSNCTAKSNLFYLPKMIYCEHCDRKFKSHEFLYTHKNKQKHYTPKLFSDKSSDGDSKAVINLIQDLPSPKSSQKNSSTTDNSNTEDQLNKQDNVENETKKPNRKRKMQKYEHPLQDDLRYQCERCAMIFNCISSLDAHKESAHGNCFQCEQCGQMFNNAKALSFHKRAHQSLKPYVCELCGRSYSQTSHLWQHMRFHQGIKPFACPHEGCEARYTIRPDLKDHIRKVHTRERPFRCSVCDKRFLTGSVYYQHRLIHTNDRRYACDICNKRFFRADALNNHRRIHTDERPFPCQICGRQFRQKGDRNKHVRTQHSS